MTSLQDIASWKLQQISTFINFLELLYYPMCVFPQFNLAKCSICTSGGGKLFINSPAQLPPSAASPSSTIHQTQRIRLHWFDWNGDISWIWECMTLTEFYAELKCETVWHGDMTFSRCRAQISIRGVRKSGRLSLWQQLDSVLPSIKCLWRPYSLIVLEHIAG